MFRNWKSIKKKRNIKKCGKKPDKKISLKHLERAMNSAPILLKEGAEILRCAAEVAESSKRKQMRQTSFKESIRKPKEQDVVYQLVFPMLSSRTSETSRTLSEDLSSLSNAVNGLIDAKNTGILTDEEVESVIKFLASRFALRRFDRIMNLIAEPKFKNGFFTKQKFVSDERGTGEKRKS